MDNITLDTIHVDDIKGAFFIPNYQRGYRWDEEMSLLLKDIDSIPKGDQYCLQPIVVKKLDNGNYELIDGQQRMTSLYLIYKYLIFLKVPTRLKYSISYQTREDSKAFLENIETIDESYKTKNIDEYFILKAYKTIEDWFSQKANFANVAWNIYNKLCESINIIWYEVSSKEKSEDLFTRLNIGRIPLTNAELVRALFLGGNSSIDKTKQIEIATEWDTIEKELNNQSLWYFITKRNQKDYDNKIELLFDLIAKKKGNDREKYRTFFYFYDEVNNENKDKSEIWKDILSYYQQLVEWYDNTDIYHKIGYLVASETCEISDLIDESKGKGKKEFQDSLDKKIADSINFDDYSDLRYDKNSDRPLIERILLLFNIETIRQKHDPLFRFPFDRHKGTAWSLEHIHAQQSEGLATEKEWRLWLNLHRKSLESIDNKRYIRIIEEIDKTLAKKEIGRATFNYLSAKVVNLLTSDSSDNQYMHMLSNMALLSIDDNSALNNSTFDVKRDAIIRMDKAGDYIPVCTRNIFLKYYTPSDSCQLHFWGKPDRDGYIANMNKVLEKYLTLIQKEIKI